MYINPINLPTAVSLQHCCFDGLLKLGILLDGDGSSNGLGEAGLYRYGRLHHVEVSDKDVGLSISSGHRPYSLGQSGGRW